MSFQADDVRTHLARFPGEKGTSTEWSSPRSLKDRGGFQGSNFTSMHSARPCGTARHLSHRVGGQTCLWAYCSSLDGYQGAAQTPKSPQAAYQIATGPSLENSGKLSPDPQLPPVLTVPSLALPGVLPHPSPHPQCSCFFLWLCAPLANLQQALPGPLIAQPALACQQSCLEQVPQRGGRGTGKTSGNRIQWGILGKADLDSRPGSSINQLTAGQIPKGRTLSREV